MEIIHKNGMIEFINPHQITRFHAKYGDKGTRIYINEPEVSESGAVNCNWIDCIEPYVEIKTEFRKEMKL